IVAHSRDAAGVVALQRECATIEEALRFFGGGNDWRRGLDVIDDEHAIETHLHVFAAHRDVDLEPSVIRDELLVDVTQAVERSGLLTLAIVAGTGERVVELDFETLDGKSSLLIRRVKVDAAIAPGTRQRFHFEFEVLEHRALHRAGVEEMRAPAIGDDLAFSDVPCVFVFAGPPPVKIAAVEKLNPIAVRGNRRESRYRPNKRTSTERLSHSLEDTTPCIPSGTSVARHAAQAGAQPNIRAAGFEK